ARGEALLEGVVLLLQRVELAGGSLQPCGGEQEVRGAGDRREDLPVLDRARDQRRELGMVLTGDPEILQQRGSRGGRELRGDLGGGQLLVGAHVLRRIAEGLERGVRTICHGITVAPGTASPLRPSLQRPAGHCSAGRATAALGGPLQRWARELL